MSLDDYKQYLKCVHHFCEKRHEWLTSDGYKLSRPNEIKEQKET